MTTTIPVSTITDWLTGLGWDAADPLTDAAGIPFYPGPYIQKTPDRIVTITKVGGPGLMLEGAADAIQFQARVRGMQSPIEFEAYNDAEQVAAALDQVIFTAPFPVTVDGQTLVRCWRTGSSPVPLSPAPDDADRYEFVTTYLLIGGV